MKKSLVEPSEFTGANRTLMMIDRSLLQVPTAMCIVRSPLLSGRVDVLCIEDPVCDLIIGNVAGVHPIELCPTNRECGLQSKKRRVASRSKLCVCRHSVGLHATCSTSG